MSQPEELSKLLKAISSPVKLRILNLICAKSMSLNEIQKFIAEEFNIKYPQTTYNYLEKLVEIEIVKKKYDQESKLIKYELMGSQLIINFKSISYTLK